MRSRVFAAFYLLHAFALGAAPLPPQLDSWITAYLRSPKGAERDELQQNANWLNDRTFSDAFTRRLRQSRSEEAYAHALRVFNSLKTVEYSSFDQIFLLGLTSPEFKRAAQLGLNVYFARVDEGQVRAQTLSEMIKRKPQNQSYMDAWLLTDKAEIPHLILSNVMGDENLTLRTVLEDKTIESLLIKYPELETTKSMAKWLEASYAVTNNYIDSKLLALIRRNPNLLELPTFQQKIATLQSPTVSQRRLLNGVFAAAKNGGVSEGVLRKSFGHILPEAFSAEKEVSLGVALKANHHEVLDPALENWEKNGQALMQALREDDVAEHLVSVLSIADKKAKNDIGLRRFRHKLLALMVQDNFELPESNPLAIAIREKTIDPSIDEFVSFDSHLVKELLTKYYSGSADSRWAMVRANINYFGAIPSSTSLSCAAKLARMKAAK